MYKPRHKPVLYLERLLAHLRTPLYQNGYALLLSGAATSGLGLVYWVLAARYYSPETLGVNSAALSAMLFLSGISQLSLNGVLVRFTPVAGRATKWLVIYSYLISLSAALVASCGFILGIEIWSPTLRFLNTNRLLLVLFVLATMVWCIFALQDSVMTGLRQAMWVPIENTLFSIAKIGLLIAFANVLQHYGIFASWTIPVALSLVPINLLIFRRLIPKHVEETPVEPSPHMRRQIIRFVGGNYLGTLFFLTSTTLLPIMVADQAGPRANAYFYQPWMITSALQLVAVNMTTSLTVEATRDRSKLSTYCFHVFMHTLRLLVPLVLVILLGAPYILQIFGRDYAAEGAGLMRLLALATIPNSVVLIYLSAVRVQNHIGRVVLVQGALCVLALGLSYLLLQRFHIVGIGLAWLMSQTVVAVVLILTQLRPILRHVRIAYMAQRGEKLAS
ncbi:MAG TPA: oligosaccharide flippase family protein [Roseiflexaceae bacterium]|nr:oligosaccharide flippase family protein [Roseiflexaceae bacterium]